MFQNVSLICHQQLNAAAFSAQQSALIFALWAMLFLFLNSAFRIFDKKNSARPHGLFPPKLLISRYLSFGDGQLFRG